jgi:large subunit ribosomal protein L4
MVQVPVVNTAGKQVDKVELPADIFEVEVNTGLMHQAYVRQMANARQGTHSTLRRSEVRMTGAKAYRQKGTGRARHGARSAPIFVGGGVAMGPKPRKYTKDMPKKMRQGALKSALSALVRDEQLVVVDKIDIQQPKTKEMKQMLNAITGGENALVLFTRGQEMVQRSVNNLPKSGALLVNYLNIRDLLKHDKVVMTLDALQEIQSIWGREG